MVTTQGEIVLRQFEIRMRNTMMYHGHARDDGEYLDIAVWVAMALDDDEIRMWEVRPAPAISRHVS